MNIITPQTVPNSNDRFVMIQEGELQRLRQYTADVIALLHQSADRCKQSGAFLKKLGRKEHASQVYKTAAEFRARATALGKSQYALKHQALSNTEVVEYFNAVGISLVQTSTLPDTDYLAVESRSNAWLAVTDVLQEVAPNYMMKDGTGKECALQAIRDLAAGTYKQPE